MSRGPNCRSSSSGLKVFRPTSWYDFNVKSTHDYIIHLLIEIGHLGLNIYDIERSERAPHTQTVLSDLMRWLSNQPGEAYAKLVDWRSLNFNQLRQRIIDNKLPKPRIELSAHITKMNNLSVRWHPRGWRDSRFDWDNSDRNYLNLITHRKWEESPDFHWFEGDQESTFNSRPSNELMYLRGVGNLDPDPKQIYGPFIAFNRDVVDSLLICAVRCAYENLIEQLEQNFEVQVIDAFDFVTQDETHGDDVLAQRHPIHRVVSWSLEDALELAERRSANARVEQERQDRQEITSLPNRYGFTIEAFVEAVVDFSKKKATGPIPTVDGANRNVAKHFRSRGSEINAGDVRRIRSLILLYSPEAFPSDFQDKS